MVLLDYVIYVLARCSYIDVTLRITSYMNKSNKVSTMTYITNNANVFQAAGTEVSVRDIFLSVSIRINLVDQCRTH